MMIDVPISQQDLDNWLKDVNLVAEISNSKATLIAWNAAGELSSMLSSDSAADSEIQAILCHLSGNHSAKTLPSATLSAATSSIATQSKVVPSNTTSTLSSNTFETSSDAQLAQEQLISPNESISVLPRLGHHQITTSLSVSELTELVRQSQLIIDTRQHSDWRSCSSIGSVICLSLAWPSGANFGFLCFYHHEAQGVDSKTLRLAKLISDSIQHRLGEILSQHSAAEALSRGAPSNIDTVDLQSFIDSFEEHIWMKNAAGIYTLCNRSVEKAWEMPRCEIVGKSDAELFGEDIADIFLEGDRLAIESGMPIIVAECLDGGETKNHLWLETLKLPTLNPHGEFVGVIGMTRNISKHKAVEEQLTLATNVFKNSVEGVVVTDRHGNITDVNGAFFEITGYVREELLGQNPRIFSSGRHDKTFFDKLWNALLANGKWNGEIWNRRKNGTIFPQNITISTIYDEVGDVRYFVAVFADISAQKENEAQLTHLAYFDPLTHLPNRMKFMMQLKQEVRQAKRLNLQLATVMIDVDLFKHINDSFGHSIGDEMLVELAKRLRSQVGDQDVLSRIGGDEFVALISGIDNSEDATVAIHQLRQVFEQPFIVSTGDHLRLTASMGVSLYPSDGADADTLLRNADAAMYRAKNDGRNNYAFYTESLTQQSFEHLKLQSALYGAIEQNALYLMYQPKLDLVSRKTVGFEALLRWHDPQLGLISPAVFIPVAEKIGLIHEIGLWVLETACRQGMRWLSEGKHFGRIAVNVAGQQLQRSSFVDDVKRVLAETGLPAKHLELEVTESVMMQNPDLAIRDLKLLGDLGIELSVDDFGTGYSSLNYLKKLPIHKLKIDQSFVRDIPFDTNNTAIAKAVIALGHALKLDIIAEGVETKEQADFLQQNQCDQAQGYLFSRPQLPEDLDAFLS
ncbi:putative bifunctional diguanylate cyclase/phosphodiesterase [Shewanella septentrionalis]|uniref:cyclic-guanylate-specific phosphodiesterase n=1 Tax=Shewanella septentrionalis TaxID=2952223 RepID=A0A9X3AXD4_9GAMM|nr:bifunctional diguanylate cyclase/phosphodiesterase [Shewanella septentrionalis]MCT7944525.1 EAL domain-containing protein [Shewanella septentrionalis]